MPLPEMTVAIGEALWLAVRLSAPALLLCFAVGLGVGLLQRALQLQDGVLTFVPKWLALLVLLGATGATLGRQLLHFTLGLWQRLPS